MSEPDKPIRIFISCIQREMKKERDLLEKEVFPALIERFSKLEFYWSESAAGEEDFTLNLSRIDECDLFIACSARDMAKRCIFLTGVSNLRYRTILNWKLRSDTRCNSLSQSKSTTCATSRVNVSFSTLPERANATEIGQNASLPTRT